MKRSSIGAALKKRPGASKLRMSTAVDIPLRPYLLDYAINILDGCELTEEYCRFILSIMDVKERRGFISALYGKEPGIENRSNYGEVLSRIATPRHCDTQLFEDLSGNRAFASLHDAEERIRRSLLDLRRRCRDTDSAAFLKRIDQLADLFELDRDDVDLLIFAYCMFGVNAATLNDLVDGFTYPRFQQFAAAATGVHPAVVRSKLSFRGRLIESRVIEDINIKRSDFIELEDGIIEFLSGTSDISLTNRFLRRDEGEGLSLDAFTVPAESVEIMRRLIASPGPCNLLLYGTAGTGKTQFARALARTAGLHVHFLTDGKSRTDSRRGMRRDVDDRLMALTVAMKSVPADRGIVIIDEADTLLNTSDRFFSAAVEKGWMNDFLDRADAKFIWITNNFRAIEESTLRRFSYSLHFPPFRERERVRVWRNILRKHPLKKLFTRELVDALARDYRVNAGGIAASLDAVTRLFKGRRPTPGRVESAVREVLSRHEAAITGRDAVRKKAPLNALTERYDPAALNTEPSREAVEESMAAFTAEAKRGPVDVGMNLLFWGLPGTGKTEFAKHLAKRTGQKLIVKRCSDMESMWVGQTEKNIRDAFTEARDEGAILFIDEADTFFTSRESAQRSWEVSRTNEFLQQMENHTGILICCTNLLPSLDRAALRRFAWKVEFKPLFRKMRLRLFSGYFLPKGKSLAEGLAARVLNLEGITPGDMQAVWLKRRHCRERLVLESVVADLEQELAIRSGERGRIVGFGGGA